MRFISFLQSFYKLSISMTYVIYIMRINSPISPNQLLTLIDHVGTRGSEAFSSINPVIIQRIGLHDQMFSFVIPDRLIY